MSSVPDQPSPTMSMVQKKKIQLQSDEQRNFNADLEEIGLRKEQSKTVTIVEGDKSASY